LNRSALARVATTTLGTPGVERTFARLTAGKLRVLAYHGIVDPAAFAHQLDHLAERYAIVSGSTVARAIDHAVELPPRAVWVTFDDGRPEVVDVALPLLVERRMPATLFLCPSFVGRAEPFWWDVVEWALRIGIEPELAGRRWSDTTLVTYLKTLPDRERRVFVDDLRADVDERGGLKWRQLSVHQLREWQSQGYEIGNHSWDHPCLDRCTRADQESQVVRAHETLRELVGHEPNLFAYPNGNWSGATDQVLRRLGYRLALVCDHRLSSLRSDPFRLSRLRVDADAPLPRFRAIASGAHSAVFRVSPFRGRGS
jgi:peptidoglycan/xylan/chitin deacetylase (PgdA/CDA1 family)